MEKCKAATTLMSTSCYMSADEAETIKSKLWWPCQLQKLSTLLLEAVVHRSFGSNNS